MSVNARVADVLYELGELFTIKGDRFRSRAFNLAAQRVTALTESVEQVRERGELQEIPGVGKSIASVIEEVLDTGRSGLLEELRESLPMGVREMLELEGVGPKTAMRLNKELGLTSVDELEAAIKAGRLRGLKGFREKTEQNILKSIEEHRARQGRFLLGAVLPVIEGVLGWMAASEAVLEVEAAGSARRRKETVGDIDILAASDEPERAVERFVSMPPIIRVISQGTTKSTVVLEKNLQVDIRVIPPEVYGAALLYFTGSKDHNIKLRTLAVRKGFKLSEYGLFERETGNIVASKTEEEVYSALGLDWMPPELRENRGEIEAAMERRLPRLVTLDQIRGDLHVHTDWSDGNASIEEMALRARELGLEYIAICDHSKSLYIANGLDEERLRKQMSEIDRLNERLEGVTILKGVECDIKPDGSLDHPDSLLRDLDFVVASVHSGFRSSERDMTQRVVKALHNDHVSTLGHPTQRVIMRRTSYSVNLEEVLEVAAAQGVMMEINAYPDRLDLDDVNCRAAKERGIVMSIGTDAHALLHLDFLHMGVSVARRGWLEAGDVVNTMTLKDLLRVLGRG